MAAINVYMPTQKESWLPSDNNIMYAFDTSLTQPRLSYLIYVKINGVLVTRWKIPVYDRQYMLVDLSPTVCSYLTNTYVNNIMANTLVAGETAMIELEVYPQYQDANGDMLTDTANMVVTKPIYVWKAASEFDKARSIWEYTKEFEYAYPSSVGYGRYPRFMGYKREFGDVRRETKYDFIQGYYMLNRNLTKGCYEVNPLSQRTFSYDVFSRYYSSVDNHTCWAIVVCYDSNLKITKCFTKELHQPNVFSISNYDKRIFAFPCGVSNLNAYLATFNQYLFYGSTSPWIDTDEDEYYFITICEKEFGTNAADFGVQTPTGYKWVGFHINDCIRFTDFDILYKSSEGGWNCISANLKHNRSTKIETSVKNNIYAVYPYKRVGNDWRGKNTMHTKGSGTYTLNTDWISEQREVDEIEDMIQSPLIYLIRYTSDGSVDYIPVQLNDGTFDLERTDYGLVAYTFTFTEAYDKYTLI